MRFFASIEELHLQDTSVTATAAISRAQRSKQEHYANRPSLHGLLFSLATMIGPLDPA